MAGAGGIANTRGDSIQYNQIQQKRIRPLDLACMIVPRRLVNTDWIETFQRKWREIYGAKARFLILLLENPYQFKKQIVEK